MKSYTDLKQSKKLAEFLPLVSADMRFEYILPRISDKILHNPTVGNPIKALEMYNKGYTIFGSKPLPLDEYCIPCWSLAALLEILPIDFVQYKHYFLEVSKMGDVSKPYEVRYYRFREDWEGADYGRITHISYTADNPVDACVAMIEKLHEQKLL